MLRVAVLDPHPALRRGMRAILEEHAGVAFAGAAADEHDLAPLLRRAQPDLVVVDRVFACLHVKRRVPAPRVVAWTRRPLPQAAVAARLAGADGLVASEAPVRELLDVVRRVGAGERVVPAVTHRLQAEAAGRLSPVDRSILAMRLAGTPADEIAEVVSLSGPRLAGRLAAIVVALSAPAPAAEHGTVVVAA